MSKQSSNPIKILVLLTAVVFVLITIMVVVVTSLNKENEEIILTKQVPVENQPTIGNLKSPVSVVEFGDYKCPACREWSEYIYPLLKKDYIDTGKISFTYINVLFHGDESFLGSLAGEAVWNQDPDAFWEFNKALYEEQPPRENHDDFWISLEKVMEVAKNSAPHLDLELLEQDIVNMKYKEDVQLDDQLVKEFNVELTPSIVINGVMVDDPYDYDYIKELIERGLKE